MWMLVPCPASFRKWPVHSGFRHVFWSHYEETLWWEQIEDTSTQLDVPRKAALGGSGLLFISSSASFWYLISRYLFLLDYRRRLILELDDVTWLSCSTHVRSQESLRFHNQIAVQHKFLPYRLLLMVSDLPIQQCRISGRSCYQAFWRIPMHRYVNGICRLQG